MKRQRGIVQVFTAVLILLLGAFVIFFGSRLPSVTSILFPQAAAAPKPINVLEIRYFPRDPNYKPTPTDKSQLEKTNALSLALPTWISDSSKAKGYKNATATAFSVPVIKRSITRLKNSPYTTGSNELWYDSMNTMLTADGEDLCAYIVANNIDQVWFWKDVDFDNGGYSQEYTTVWSNNILPKQSKSLCAGKRTFTILGLDQNRGIGEALHIFGHSLDGIISSIQGSDLYWTKWTGTNAPKRICGDVHFPPNAETEYDYMYRGDGVTPCEDWKPDGTGVVSVFGCTRWGCSQEGYMKWWLQNAPNANNGLAYGGKVLPNWWDLLSDTDKALSTAATSGQFLYGDYADFAKPTYIDAVTRGSQNSGTSITLNHTVSGLNRFLVVSASYRSVNQSTSDKISLATAKGVTGTIKNLTYINRINSGEYTTEMWYLIAPELGVNSIVVNFTGNVQDQVVASVSMVGIHQSSPLANPTGYVKSGSGTTPSISVPSNSAQVLLGATAMYTGGSNEVTTNGTALGVWGQKTSNMIGKGATVVGGATATLSWNSKVSWPWSITAVALNLTTASVTPTPKPTPTPLTGPKPTVNIKANNLDVVDMTAAAPVTLSWTTTNATSCTSSMVTGGEGGLGKVTPTPFTTPGWSTTTRGTSGTFVTNSITTTSVAYFVSCTGPGGFAEDAVTIHMTSGKPIGPVLYVFVNGVASGYYPNKYTPVFSYVKSGTAPVVNWIASGMRSCTGSNGWSGAKSVTGGSQLASIITTTTLYTITCTTTAGATVSAGASAIIY